MKNNIKMVVCDIDGTLLKPDGKTLQKGVAKFAKTLFDAKMPMMFVSGKNYAEIEEFIDILCAESGISKQEFKPIIASNSGAFVEELDKANSLSATQMTKISEIITRIDPSALVVYKTLNNNFIDRARDAKGLIAKIKRASVKTIKDVLVAMRKFDLKAVPMSSKDINSAIKSNMVLSLNILSFKCDRIAKEIQKEFPNLCVSPSGLYIDLSPSSKFEVVKNIAEKRGLKKQNIACFGDSTNDEEMLLNSGSLNFLCNVKSKRTVLFSKVTAKAGGYATDDLGDEELIKAITNQLYDEQNLKEMTSIVSDRMKFDKESKAIRNLTKK